ncbi:cytosolic phospholipase A2 beta-like isoform X2 [Rhineura floridana]|uniref:cytosolic phospholipase A2 beta-like isoform X2 n=1 Tax=Rhineura floridana TaxID=261503 RepID=UPI002AC8485B|nr:cytosolic phospholipase A2 beta-like isoform X2 [Rhineura floridana]
MGSGGEKKQLFPVSMVSVRIIKANIITSKDSLSASDCYVTLHLPTASPEKFRTQTIKNSNKPVWNETFYFRVQTEIKNILQLEVCDADPVTKDDVQFVILFDLAKVRPGVTDLELFSIKPEKEERPPNYESLEVEFKLAETSGPLEQLISNGVLVARELSILDVKVKKEENEKLLKAKKNVVLTMRESYEGTQKTSEDVDSFRFHCIKSWGPVLKAKLQSVSREEKNDSHHLLILPLKLLPVGQQVKVALPMEEGGTLELYLKVIDCPQNLDVRLGYELCASEQDFLHKRKKMVAGALNKLFHLRRELLEHEVPVMGVMATGGGVRAMTALYGHLLGLQKLNLLDCVSYITTASGSTWTMTDLYRNIDWSQKSLEERIKVVRSQMLKSKYDIISIERLKYYHKELVERVERGHLPSFTALWALVQEAFLHEKPNYSTLSEQRQALNQGQNPLPIYTAINVKDKNVSTFDFREWVEFSPYEVGFQKYGANIRAEDFDSEFFMGKLVKRIPESRICYLEGEEDEGYVTVYKPPSSGTGKLCEIFNDILTDRPLKGDSHNFLRRLDFDKGYLQQKEFSEWRDTVLDAFPSKLTPVEKSLCLIDIGYFINNSGQPLLKPERNVDILIALDYGINSGFQQTEMMAKYCEVQGIPFPKVDITEEDRKNPKECYVFSDEDNPKAPILLYFPLVNATFKEYKAPGVKRIPSEMNGGEVNLSDDSPYKTMHLTYTEEDFDKLLSLCTYNILCSKDHILQAFQCAIQKKQNIWLGGLNISSA